jgi:uncharacterized protein
MLIKKLRIGGDPTGINVSVAEGFLSRLTGFMLSIVEDDEALLLPDCAGIHTFFMFSTIDVIFLDAGFKVLKVVPGLKPWRAAAHAGAGMVLELPRGAAANLGIKIGDGIELEERTTDED